MKNKHPNGPDILAQQGYITQFCSRHSLIDMKTGLLQWLVLTIKAGGDAATHVRTNEFSDFYDELNRLLTAVYDVHYKAPTDRL